MHGHRSPAENGHCALNPMLYTPPWVASPPPQTPVCWAPGCQVCPVHIRVHSHMSPMTRRGLGEHNMPVRIFPNIIFAPKLVRGMDGLVVCAMAGARRGRGFEPGFVRPSTGPSVRPPPPPPSASRSTTGTAGATGGVSPPFFLNPPPPPPPTPGVRHTHKKRSTKHSTPAAARSVTATAVRRVAHVLLILLFRLPAEEDSNRGLQGGGLLRDRSTMLRKTQRKSGPPIPPSFLPPPP